MRLLNSAIMIAGVLLLSACSTIQAVAPPDLKASLQRLGAFTVTDLQNADTIAQAQVPVDVIGHTCFVGLEAFIQSQQVATGSPSLTVSGAFSALEAGRTAVSNATTLISKSQIQSLELACGPLVIDTQNQAALFIATLAALGAK